MTAPEPVNYYPICGPCVRAEGQECHTPECALYMNTVDVGLIEDFALELLTRDAHVAAEALREAAVVFELPGSSAIGYYASEAHSGYNEAERHVAKWLNDRADEIERGALLAV